jgi:hypothetical protein
MVIVASSLFGAPEQRAAYLADAKLVVGGLARAPTAWSSPSPPISLTRHGLSSSSGGSPGRQSRPSGGGRPSGDQAAAILGGSVSEYEVAAARPLM